MKLFKSSKKILMVILILVLVLELTPFQSFALASSVVEPSESREGEGSLGGLAPSGNAEQPADAAPQADGEEPSTDLTMNNHKFEWISGNNITVISDNKLNLDTTPTAKDRAQVKGRVTFSVGGNDGVKAGEAVIRVPRYIFETRDGQPTGDIMLSIPEAPKTGGTTSFNYSVEDNGTPDDPSDDVIVIKNYEDIKKGGFVMEADIVWYYPPIEVANGYEVDDITADFQVTGSTSGVTKEAESDPASVKLHTKTYAPRASKEEKVKLDTWKSQWGEAPENSQDYYYVVWKLGANIASGSTSAYSIYFDDIVMDGGEVVACSESYSHSYSLAEPKTFQRITEQELKETPIYEVKKNADYNDYTSIYPTKDVVVAYPKSALEGGATPTVQNKVEARVETPEGDVKKSEAVASYTYEYVSNDVPYEGDTFKTDKKPRVSQTESAASGVISINGAADLIKKGTTVTNGFTVGVKNYGWNQTGADDGTGNLTYGENPYETVIRDGMLYIEGERLEPGDYDLISFSPYSYDTYTAIVNPDTGASLGTSTDYDSYEPIDVYVKKDDGQWEKFGRVEKTAVNKYKWTGEDGTTNNNVSTTTLINLPEGVNDIKFVHSGKDYGVSYRMSLKYKLYPTEHVQGIIENVSTFKLTNVSEAWGEQDDEIYTAGNKLGSSTTKSIKEDVENSDVEDYGAADKVCHATSSHNYGPVSPTSSFAKSMSTPVNDTDNGLVKTTVTLTMSNYVSIYTMGIPLVEAADLELVPESREGIFYDLLPKGTTVDLTTIKATTKSTICIDNSRMPDCEYTVEMIENWRDSGQTMMKVKVTAPEGFRNYVKSTSYLETGFALKFTLIDSWDNIETNGTYLYNESAYYGFDGDYKNGEADTGGKYNKEMFEDLDGDGNQDENADKNCLYSKASRDIDVARAAQMGFSKRVKSAESTGYDSKTTVPLTGSYSYQLRFALEDKAKASGVILYDVIENAYTDADNGHWVGTFNGINTAQIRDAYPEADVQVFYSVSKDIVKEDGQIDTGIFDVSKTDIWTKGVPSEDIYGEVTAIAIDISKTKTGQPMEFEGKMAISAEVYMKSPSEESLLDQEQTPDIDESIKAKNKAYLTQDGKEMEGSNTTTVTPVKPNINISKSSSPYTGTKSFPRVISAGSQLKYFLTTSNNNLAEAIEGVTVVDTIPDNLTIDAANIMYYFGGSSSDAKPADGTGRVAVKVEGQKLTFTVDKLAAKERVNFVIPTTVDATANNGVDFTNKATITEFNDAEWEIDSNEVYHKTNMVTTNVAVQKVWDDNNNQYGKRVPISVALYGDGTAVAEKTATLSVSNNWRTTFTGLPKYREDGITPIVYSVEEAAVAGYVPTYTNNNGNLVVTNTAQTVDEEVAATFKIKKLREGTNITVPGVKYELYDGTRKLSEATTDASGFANFTVQPEVTTDFELQLKEVSAPQGYIVDTTPITVKLHREQRESYDVENGQIVISHYWTVSVDGSNWNAQNATLTISNQYIPTPAEVTLPVSKVVTGAPRPAEKNFEFTLAPVGSAPMPTAPGEKVTITGNSTPQTGNFGNITFTEPGTYQYKVKETIGTETGYTYDKTEHTVKVVVVDNSGILQATWTADEKTVDAVAFTNEYTPLGTQVTLPVKKVINGNPRPEGEKQDFAFVLTGLSGAPMPTGQGNTATINDAGEAAFGTISFTKTGIFKYEVREVLGNAGGYTYDEATHTITATVTDNNGHLEVSWKSDQDGDNDENGIGDKITFTNTYTPSPVQLAVPVKKTITGSERDQQWLKAFTFMLEPVDGAPMPSGTGNAVKITDEGNNSFGAITFDKAGVYEYTIKEKAESYPRYTFDTATRNLKVTVTDTQGILSAVWTINGKEVDAVEFTNQYSPKETGLQIPVTKLVGGDPIPQDHVETYNFTLVGRGGAPMPEAAGRSVSITNGDITNVQGVSDSFGGITFTKAGTYLYEIKETNSDKRGYAYDLSTRVITVTVVDNNGFLQATWESNGADSTKVLFENDYKPLAAIIEFPVEKIITGNPRSDKYLKTFKFTLTAETAGAPMPYMSETTIIDSGEGTIGQIAVEHAGTYKYTISEEVATSKGYTYDQKVCDIVVTAVDNHGQIEAAIEYKKDGVTVQQAEFTNNYDPDDAVVTLPVSKEVSGSRRPKNKDFTFVLEAQDDAPMPENGGEQVTIRGGNDDETKSGNFGDITFTEAGTYHYTVKETQGTDKGYKYDETVYDVTVTVVDTDGKLEAQVAYANGGKAVSELKFKNQYKPETVALNIGFSKTIEGNDRSDDYLKEFNFTIVPQNGAPAPADGLTATITDAGSGQFNPITFDKEGTYVYLISETVGSDRGYGYDDTVFTITVKVTDIDGKLYASYKADTENESAEFINTYNPQDVTVSIPVQKIITGNARPNNYKKDFTFTLIGQEEAPMPSGSGNVAAITDQGTEEFGGITFEKAGVYKYTITETQGSEKGYTYDESAYDVTVTVVDENGVLKAAISYEKDEKTTDTPAFTNNYKPSEVSFAIPILKIVTGNDRPEEKTFTFNQYDGDGNVLDTKTVTGNGRTAFDPITYTKAGTYTYTVSEGEGTDKGYTYDTAQRTVEVTVVDEDGTLKASMKVNGETAQQIAFINDYTPESVDVAVPVTKAITGNPRASEYRKDFTFTLSGEGQAPMPEAGSDKVTITDEGTASFGKMTYTEVGVYKYVVKETQGNEAGYTYDKKECMVTVTVTDEGGSLVAEVTYQKDGKTIDAPEFTNEYKPAETAFAVPVEKVVTGNDRPEEKTFTFNQYDEEGELLSTKTITGNGQTTFDAITYTKAGTYTYTVSEAEGSNKGYTYDTAERTVVVTVVDEDGALRASMSVDGQRAEKVTITNTYAPEEVSFAVPVSKVITGNERPEEKEFTFNQYDQGGKLLSTKTITGKGQATFDAITYTEAGTYTYTVSEEAGSDKGYTYDEAERTVVVTVVDEDGILKASMEVNEKAAEKVEFTNNYKPEEVVFAVPVTKIVTGSDRPEEKEFTFNQYDEAGKLLSTKTITGNGQAVFDPITYTAAGTYTYTVSEAEGSDKGYTYDSKVRTVVVTVVDEEGTLKASMKVDGDEADTVNITNEYKPEEVSFAIPLAKVVTGSDRSEEKEFTFNEYDESGKLLDTKTITGNGQATFDAITYAEAGTYTYTVAEEEGTETGYTYDTEPRTVIVTVVDEDGKLKASMTVDGQAADKVTITNEYKPEEAAFAVPVTKVVTGSDRPTEKEFTFNQYDEAGKLLSTKTITGNGQAAFDTITYTAVGTYTYTVSEAEGSDKGYTYDSKVRTVVVTVVDEDGTLKASMKVDGDEADTVEITNEYLPEAVSVTVPAEKTITGNARPEQYKKDFAFQIYGEDGAPMPQKGEEEVAVTDEGTASFGKITFEKAGVYNYTVKEVAGSEVGYTYDQKECAVTITVTDIDGTLKAEVAYQKDGEEAEKPVFNNLYKPEEVAFAIPISKVVAGNDRPEEKDFVFNQYDESGNLLDTKTITGEGKAEFDAITYTEAGTYTYTVSEAVGSDNGYGYDTANRVVVVTVTDQDGVLTATMKVNGEDAAEVEFTNTYNPGETEITLPVTKEIIGASRPEGGLKDFSFVLAAKGNEPMPGGEGNKAVITDEGAANFGSITFTKAGEYLYTILEEKGKETGYIYDEKVYDVTVKVVDLEGTLSATWFIGEKEKEIPAFVNEYAPEGDVLTIPLEKTVTGDKPDADGTFKFELKQDGQVVDTVEVQGSGKGTFAELKFDAVGIYTYEVTEVAGELKGYTYDTTIYTVQISVEDTGGKYVANVSIKNGDEDCQEIKFNNVFTREEDPTGIEGEDINNGGDNPNGVSTGDSTNIVTWILAMAVAIVAAILIAIFGKKKDNSHKK